MKSTSSPPLKNQDYLEYYTIIFLIIASNTGHKKKSWNFQVGISGSIPVTKSLNYR